MSYENIYYSPEAYGLEIVGSVEWSDGCYQFDTTVVWRDKESGRLYLAEDSGCSCPSPFENHDRTTLTSIEKSQDIITHFNERKKTDYRFEPDSYYASEIPRIETEIGALIGKVRDLLRPAA